MLKIYIYISNSNKCYLNGGDKRFACGASASTCFSSTSLSDFPSSPEVTALPEARRSV